MITVLTGVGGLVLGVCALALSIVANNHAKVSASAAELSADAAHESVIEARRANKIADEANERAARAEQRATVRNDVVWSTKLDAIRQWILTNNGLDDALNVVVSLKIEGSRAKRIELGTVHSDGDEATVYDFGSELDESIVKLAEAQRSLAASGFTYVGTAKVKFTQRITWNDKAGGAHTTDTKSLTISE